MLNEIRDNDITVLFVRSPFFHDKRANIPKEISKEIIDLLSKYGHEIHDYNDPPLKHLNDMKLYKDYIHLTNEGASLYTDMIISVIDTLNVK